MKYKIFILILLFLILSSCGKTSDNKDTNIAFNKSKEVKSVSLVDPAGKTVIERIKVPEGFERINVDDKSFGNYLRNMPLKPQGYKVKYYNGFTKLKEDYVAVFDMDIGKKDLQQCADAVIRLRAEYLYKEKQYDKIHFNFTNGFRADYSKWMKGYRIRIKDNKAYWVKDAEYTNDYNSFRKYLDIVFTYAGTLSLSKELQKVSVNDIMPGDVFIKGGSPGHCEIVLDVAENKKTGEKIFLLAQSYMPAQDIHILKNPSDDVYSPWYSVNFGDKLITPEWEFTKDQLMRFKE